MPIIDKPDDPVLGDDFFLRSASRWYGTGERINLTGAKLYITFKTDPVTQTDATADLQKNSTTHPAIFAPPGITLDPTKGEWAVRIPGEDIETALDPDVEYHIDVKATLSDLQRIRLCNDVVTFTMQVTRSY